MQGVEIGTMGGRRAYGIWSIETERLEIEDKARDPSTLEMIDVEVSALDAGSSIAILQGRFSIDMKTSLVLADGSAIDLGPYRDVSVTASELHASELFVRGFDVRIVSTSLEGDGEVVAHGDEHCAGILVNGSGPLDSCP